MENLTQLIAQVGFPIAVATWMLTRIDPLLRDLTVAVRELKTVVETMIRSHNG